MITDVHDRKFKKLRVSLTEVCNLGCRYCVAKGEEDEKDAIKQVLKEKASTKKILHNVSKLHEYCQLESVRLTGGEPLLYGDITKLIEGIKKIGVRDINMTTNAVFLTNKARDLKYAGLSGVNVSLDALEQEAFFKMTRRKNLQKVLDGIEAAADAGLKVKINTVVMKGVNEDQIVPLLRYAADKGVVVRFLELMKMGHLHGSFRDQFYSQQEILGQIKKHHRVYAVGRKQSATSAYWLTETGQRFGVIANESAPFCSDCDRLRLDQQGRIYGCISSEKGLALGNNHYMEAILQEAMDQKQVDRFRGSEMSMKKIGG